MTGGARGTAHHGRGSGLPEGAAKSQGAAPTGRVDPEAAYRAHEGVDFYGEPEQPPLTRRLVLAAALGLLIATGLFVLLAWPIWAGLV